MKIRSVTCFVDPADPAAAFDANLDQLGRLAARARILAGEAGLEVQTTRLSTTPFAVHLPLEDVDGAVAQAQQYEQAAAAHGFSYLSLGPALPSHPRSAALILPILENTRNVFLSGQMAQAGQIHPAMLRAYAQIIQAAAPLEPEGFANLRFAALANVQAHGPFFPGSFHSGGRPAFALAIECADLALAAARQAGSLEEFRRALLCQLEAHGAQLVTIAAQLAAEFAADFRGIDFSLAPFPDEWTSLGAAIEALGLPALGRSGSLAAAAYLADTLDRGAWPRAGFNGLMMPVLEDAALAERSAQGVLRVHDLLMYSAVCGTGLDTVPLPGDTSAEQIYPLLLDVAALALRLNKPLTARLMPVPGKHAGDATTFEFGFFKNGGVMELESSGVRGLLAGEANFEVRHRVR